MFFDSCTCYKAIYEHILLLPNPVSSVHTLTIITWVH
uniref:Uncharacterized protein n=1 Tax=Arundo donax TaxID=35708 RepID=A0A0A8ZZQ4_ARUDO